MKLKNVLRWAFILLTLIPVIIVIGLFYKSGFELSKQSYTNNLNESINVQVDYISQTIENGLIYDSRFAKRILKETSEKADFTDSFQAYLEASEDKISVAIVLDENDQLIYSIGQKKIIDHVLEQVSDAKAYEKQEIVELELKDGAYSLGMVTPVWNNEEYLGSFISVYDQSYISKIISSYYDITNTSTYLCRNNGEVIQYKGSLFNDNSVISESFKSSKFEVEGEIEAENEGVAASGYYKSIHNSPWYLVGLIDNSIINSFTNQFLYVYIIIIILIFMIDVTLAIYFANKVVKPINGLIDVMDKYQNDLNLEILDNPDKNGYYETNYLKTKFFSLMKTIKLVQHNFQGIYQLYQSNDMGDINIDIDVKAQTIHSNKDQFKALLESIVLKEDDCVVENFVKCFCKKDEEILREIFEKMRDEHLATSKELEVFTPNLNEKWFHLVVVPLYEDDRLSRLFIQLRDISGFKKQEKESQEQVRRDALTKLYNRLGLIDYVTNTLKQNTQFTHAILFADLNYFKMVNDYFGHSEGDLLLIKIAEDLLSIVGNQGIVSRIGGDEFVIFIPDTTKEAIAVIEDSIHKKVQYTYHNKDEVIEISASVGVAIWDHESQSSFEEILHQADSSMYTAKRRFKESKE